jgi:peptidoglycan/LPS O-acetylase OafA/YrhL
MTVEAASQVSSRLRSIDALRAVAAGLVVLAHSGLGQGHPSRWLQPLAAVGRLGYVGVGLFLVISGFSIHLRWAAGSRTGFSPLAFWRRRFVRLYPTYWIALAVTAALVGLAFGPAAVLHEHTARDGMSLWAAVANELTVLAGNGFAIALIPQAWSIALEEQLYALYSVLSRFRSALQPLRLLAVSFALAMTFRLGVAVLFPGGTARRLMYFQVPSRWFEWMLGLVAAEAYCGRIRLPRITRNLGAGLGIVAVAAYLGLHPGGALHVGGRSFPLSTVLLEPLFGIGFFLCLQWFVEREASRAGRSPGVGLRALAAVGLSSYSMYLLHPVILRVVGAWVPGQGIVRRLVLWAAVVAGSYGFYLAVERRFIRRAGRRRAQGEPTGARREDQPSQAWAIAQTVV